MIRANRLYQPPPEPLPEPPPELEPLLEPLLDPLPPPLVPLELPLEPLELPLASSLASVPALEVPLLLPLPLDEPLLLPLELPLLPPDVPLLVPESSSRVVPPPLELLEQPAPEASATPRATKQIPVRKFFVMTFFLAGSPARRSSRQKPSTPNCEWRRMSRAIDARQSKQGKPIFRIAVKPPRASKSDAKRREPQRPGAGRP
jgi:hypothetical protein